MLSPLFASPVSPRLDGATTALIVVLFAAVYALWLVRVERHGQAQHWFERAMRAEAVVAQYVMEAAEERARRDDRQRSGYRGDAPAGRAAGSGGRVSVNLCKIASGYALYATFMIGLACGAAFTLLSFIYAERRREAKP